MRNSTRVDLAWVAPLDLRLNSPMGCADGVWLHYRRMRIREMTKPNRCIFGRVLVALFALAIACSAAMAQLAHADEGANDHAITKADVVTLAADDGVPVCGVIVIIGDEYLFLMEDKLLPLEKFDGWNEAMLGQATSAYGKAAEGEHGLTGPGVVVKEQKDAYDSGEVLFVKDGGAMVVAWQQASGASGERSFADVAADSWVVLEGWLEKALDAGIVAGYKDAAGSTTGLFGPDDPMKRGQLFAMLYRASVDDASDSTELSKYASNSVAAFHDNLDGQFYTAAVNWAYDQGIVAGDADEDGAPLGTVRPDDPISRQEMATVLHRFAGKGGVAGDGAYEKAPDAASVTQFAREGVAWCFSNGVMTGDAQTGNLMPFANATRAQACKMVMAALESMEAGSTASNLYAEIDENGNRIK